MADTADLVVGIDGYPRGWVAATLSSGVVLWATAAVDEVASLCPEGAVVGIDIPIGLADAGWRDCDALAKQALGRAHSRVFMTPPRGVLELGPAAPNADAQALSRALTGQGVSRQALALGPRILAVDALLQHRQAGTIVEVFPELSFAAMAGRVLDSKKSARGVGQRLSALRGWRSDVARALADAPADVPIDDALDALAALWTADRHARGQSTGLPQVPVIGSRGVPMQIVT